MATGSGGHVHPGIVFAISSDQLKSFSSWHGYTNVCFTASGQSGLAGSTTQQTMTSSTAKLHTVLGHSLGPSLHIQPCVLNEPVLRVVAARQRRAEHSTAAVVVLHEDERAQRSEHEDPRLFIVMPCS